MLGLWMAATAAWGYGQYCLPSYNNPCTTDDYIDLVNFAGIVHSGSGCGTPGTNNYTDYSGTYTANVVVNQPYTITCAPGPTWGQYFVAMIDINHDNDFADPGEFFDVGYAPGGGNVTNTITVPCNALTGATRLRIMCQYSNTQLFQADICSSNLSFGEVEDYNIVIAPATGTNARLVRFVSPVSACGMGASETVSVRIANVGGNVINGYTVCYRIGAGTPVCETVATTIPVCDSVLHTFATPANLSIAGQYNFRAYVTVAGDVSAANDTVSNHLVDNIPVVSALPYTENFDVTTGGWTAGGASSSWAWGVPTATFISAAASPANAWVTNLGGTHNLDEDSYLTSPCFNLSALTADPYLTFSHIYETDGFGDYDYVELSTDAGATWTKVGAYGTGNNWYNVQFSDFWSGASGQPGDWVPADHPLTGAAGSSAVRFRFHFISDAFTSFEGVGIDDVRLVDTLKNAGIVLFNAPLNGCQLGANEAVSVSIHNYGSHPISNIPVCFTFNGGSPVCEVAAGPIAPGANYTHTFAATVNMSTPGPYDFVGYTSWGADYTHLNDTLRSTIQSFPLISSFPYMETFEANAGGWVAGGTAFNDWAYGTPSKLTISGAASGTKAWVTGGLGTTSYQDNADSWVESPCFDLSTLANPWITAQVWWNSESSWDGTVLEFTTNSGLTWNEIGAFGDPFNWYTESSIYGLTVVGGTGNGWAGRAATSNGSNGYVLAKHEIAALAGQTNVRFRIHFATDGSVTDDGFAFDNFVVADPPTVALGPDTTVCIGLTLNPGFTAGAYSWSNGDTTPTLAVTAPGTYSLAYTDTLGLVGRDTIVVAFSPTPAVDLGPDQIICHGDTHCLMVNPALYGNIHWSTGDTTSQICTTIAGTWSVGVEDSMGCTSADTVTTTVVAIPTPFIGADTSICAGDTICFSANCGPTNTYVWSTGATTSTICVSLFSGYWVQCMDSNGCVGADSVLLTQAQMPVAMGTADTSNCPIVQFASTSTGTSTLWDFGDGGTSTQSSPSHDYTSAGNGSYTVTLVSLNACGSDTVTLQVDINCLVSIGAALDNQLRIFPNPSSGQFRLETTLTGTAPVQVTITDLHGKQVYHHDFGQAAGRFSEQMDLHQESKGVYFVKFDVGGHLTVQKLVLQ